MLVVRDAQMRVFAEQQTAGFAVRITAHLRKFFPGQCDGLDDVAILDRVHQGLNSAEQHGILAERDVCLYVDALFVLGPGAERIPWVGEVLAGVGVRGPHGTAELLFDTAMILAGA